jgi:hypothetical protein
VPPTPGLRLRTFRCSRLILDVLNAHAAQLPQRG